MAVKPITEPPVPAWCKPKGWAYHAPTNTVFQAHRLQIDRSANRLYLLDSYANEYPVDECQQLTPRILTAPATLAGTPIQVYPQKNGILLTHGRIKKLVQIFDDCDRAAESLAFAFNGQITLTEYL